MNKFAIVLQREAGYIKDNQGHVIFTWFPASGFVFKTTAFEEIDKIPEYQTISKWMKEQQIMTVDIMQDMAF